MKAFAAIIPLMLVSYGALAKPAGYGGGPTSAVGEDFEEEVGPGYHSQRTQPTHAEVANDVGTLAPTHSGTYYDQPATQSGYGQNEPATSGYSTLTPVSPPSYGSQRRTKAQSGYGASPGYGSQPGPAAFDGNSGYPGTDAGHGVASKASGYDGAGYGAGNNALPAYGPHTSSGDHDVHSDGGHKWEPYSFAYSAQDGEGSHSHSAQGDAQGRVKGEYTIQLADGRSRTVKYTADENGYRADIITNELGTESKNPADVTIQSSAPTGAEAAQQWTDSRPAAEKATTFNGNARSPSPAAYDNVAYSKPQRLSQPSSSYANDYSEQAQPEHPGNQPPAYAAGNILDQVEEEETPSRRRNRPSYG